MGFSPLARVTGRPILVLVTIASTCGFLLFGYDNGVFSGLIVSPWFLKTFHNPKAGLLGTVSAMYNIGGVLGGISAFFIGDRLGRRRTILTGIAVCTIGAIVQCAATDIAKLVSGRVVCGMGVGIMTSTVGIWQAEMVPTRSRGQYLCFQLLGGTAAGLFLAQWINFGFNAQTGRVAFTFPLAFQLVFLSISGSLIMILPESPRWLVKKDRRDEALAVLIQLQGETDAPLRLAHIVEADAVERGVGGNQYMQLLARGRTQNLRRLGLACGTMIMHQLGGINSVTYYLPTLLIKFIGVSHRTALWVAGMSSVTSIICATVPVLTIDRVGRRPFLWGGAIWQTVMFVIIAALLAKTPPPADGGHTYGVVTVVMIFLFFGGNAATWLGPSWTYPAEILPLQIREKGLALGNICYWLFQFMIVEITPIALTNIGYRFYVILAVFNVCIAIIVFFFFPESKGLSLEEIDFYFIRKYGSATDIREMEENIGKQGGAQVVDAWIEETGARHNE